jgi:hypothetical protein
MTNIQFVNHASYILHHDNISLITDPWIEGYAFHDGWSLIEPTKLLYSDFSKITHIWFSHEHPDHFSPQNLRSIPPEVRHNITILFQETKDKKVINFCKQLDFKLCIELQTDWYDLSDEVKIINRPHTDGDSWLCIKAGDFTVLNINDCVLENDKQIHKIKNQIKSEKIDVLFTQFSYANWVGNKEDKESRRKYAAKKINEIERQVSIFNPVHTIPFASFVWFCHEENFYMNDEINKIDFVFNHLKENLNTIPVILFPDDIWEISTKHDSEASVQKWVNSYNTNIVSEKTVKPLFIKPEELIKLGNSYVNTLKRNNTKWMYFFLKPSNIYVQDHECSYRLSLQGVERNEIDQDYCDILMSSDSLQYCFKFLWGGATTRINGRYQITKYGKFYNWKLYFQTSELNNHGERFGILFILDSVYRILRRKIYPTNS